MPNPRAHRSMQFPIAPWHMMNTTPHTSTSASASAASLSSTASGSLSPAPDNGEESPSSTRQRRFWIVCSSNSPLPSPSSPTWAQMSPRRGVATSGRARRRSNFLDPRPRLLDILVPGILPLSTSSILVTHKSLHSSHRTTHSWHSRNFHCQWEIM